MIRDFPPKPKKAHAVVIGVQDDDRALLQYRFVAPQHLHEHRRRLDR